MSPKTFAEMKGHQTFMKQIRKFQVHRSLVTAIQESSKGVS